MVWVVFMVSGFLNISLICSPVAVRCVLLLHDLGHTLTAHCFGTPFSHLAREVGPDDG